MNANITAVRYLKEWLSMTSFRKVAMAVIVSVAIVSCSMTDSQTVKIDQHVFSVPKSYILQGTIPWLPASQHDGLMFIINPDAPLPEQQSVLIQSSAITCPTNPPLGPSPLASACQAAAQRTEGAATFQRVELEKAFSNGDGTSWDGKPTPWWDYRVKVRNGKGKGDIVATCSALGNDGLCYAYGVYADLVYSVGLSDSQMGQFPAIRGKIAQLLSTWEKSQR